MVQVLNLPLIFFSTFLLHFLLFFISGKFQNSRKFQNNTVNDVKQISSSHVITNEMTTLINKKQILHAYLFNIKNHSPEVIDIQRHEASLSIILLRVNNFDIKQEKAWNICFIIFHQHQTKSGKIKAKKQQILVKTQVFFVKTELQHI